MMTSHYVDVMLWRRHVMATSRYGDVILWSRHVVMTSNYVDFTSCWRHVMMTSRYGDVKLWWHHVMVMSCYYSATLWWRHVMLTSRCNDITLRWRGVTVTSRHFTSGYDNVTSWWRRYGVIQYVDVMLGLRHVVTSRNDEITFYVTWYSLEVRLVALMDGIRGLVWRRHSVFHLMSHY